MLLLFSFSIISFAVVLLPNPQSVPKTTILGTSTLYILPLQKLNFSLFLEIRISWISTLFFLDTLTNCLSSLSIEWRPLIIDIPLSMASIKSPLIFSGSKPPAEATPIIQ